MSSFKHGLGLYLLLLVFYHNLLTSPVTCACGEKEKDLLHDINTYRKVLNLPVLEKTDKSSCLANKIANDLEHKHCAEFHNYYPNIPGKNPTIPNFEKSVGKCKININTTKDGVIMPMCVPKLDQDDLFSNYTKNSHFTKYLNNSKYIIAGVGSEDDWMVLIISTNTTSGNFSSANSLLVGAWKGQWLLMTTLFLSVFVFMFN